MSGSAENLCKRTVYILSFGASALLVILSAIYQMLGANLGSSSIIVSIFYYLTQIFSVCVFFMLVSVSVYTFFAGNIPAFAHSLTMHGLSSVFVSVLFNIAFVWLIAFIDESADLPFEISNNTVEILNDGGLIYIMSMSFLSVVSLFLVVLTSFLIMRPLLRKYKKNYIDLSLEALAAGEENESPLKIPMSVFAGCFAVISFIFQVLDTFNTISVSGAPISVNDYVYLITPYFMLVIYTLAGYFTMQYFMGWFSKKMYELSKS